MAPSDTDDCAHTESRIGHSRCGALDTRKGRQIGAHPDSIGLHKQSRRKNWTKTKTADIKVQLLQYNQDDCRALKHVVESIDSLISSDVPPPPGYARGSVINAADLTQASRAPHRFRKIEFAMPDLDVVNRSAYFDYQRQKIFVRAS